MQIENMRAVVQEVFQVLLAVLIPLAAFTTGLRAPPAGVGKEQLAAAGRVVPRAARGPGPGPALGGVPGQGVPLAAGVPAGLLIAAIAVGIGPAAEMKRMGGGTAAARDALDLNMVVLVLSLAFVPLAFAALAALFHADLQLGVGAVAKVVLGRALVPLVVGLAVARWQPRFAASAGQVLSKIVTTALVALVAVALLATWRSWPGWARVGGPPASRPRSAR